MSKEVATADRFDKIQELLASGNIDQFSPKEKVEYINRICEATGLNPLTRPFEFIRFQGKTVLYASKGCTDQLRSIHSISIRVTEKKIESGVLFITVEAQGKDSRVDSDMGAIPVDGLKGDALANAMMKCLTKAKRRVTLSICGLGMLDESEFDTMGEDALEKGLKEQEKREEIHERIEQKIIQAESIGEIEGLMEKIKASMSKLTEGETVVTKGLAMHELLGVLKFDELKKFSVAELTAKLETVDEQIKEKKLRAKPSFKLEP